MEFINLELGISGSGKCRVWTVFEDERQDIIGLPVEIITYIYTCAFLESLISINSVQLMCNTLDINAMQNTNKTRILITADLNLSEWSSLAKELAAQV